MRNRISSRIASSLVALATVAAVVPARADTTERLDRAGRSTNPASQTRPSIANAENGPVVIFSDDRDLAAHIRAARLSGSTWSDDVLFDNGYVPAALASDGIGNAWAVSFENGAVRTKKTNGNGVWTDGPSISTALGMPTIATGGAGLVVLAWTVRYPCIAMAGGVAASSFPMFPSGPVKVAVLDARASSAGPIEELGGDDITNAAADIAADGRILLATTRQDGIDVYTRDTSGAWSSPTIAVREAALEVAVTSADANAIALAWISADRSVRASHQSALLGTWSDSVTVAPNGQDLQLSAVETNKALPLVGGISLDLFWLDATGLRSSSYRQSISVLPASWGAPVEIASGAGAFDVDGDRLTYSVYDEASASDVLVMNRAADTWSAPVKVHDDTPYAASKNLELLVPAQTGFQALWSDDEGRKSSTIRRSHLPDAGEQIETGWRPGSVMALAPDGSRLEQAEGDGTTIIAHDEIKATSKPTTLPMGDIRAVSIGPATFVVSSGSYRKGIVTRVYANGIWSRAYKLPIPNFSSLTLIHGGNGVAWLGWIEAGAEGGAPTDALVPKPYATRYAVRAVPVTTSGLGATRSLVTGHSDSPPFLSATGDGGGGMAAVWDEYRDGSARVVFATTSGAVDRLERPDGVFAMRVAARPSGDAVIAWTSFDAIHTKRRRADGVFTQLPDVPISNEGFGDIPWPCGLATTIALPGGAELAATPDGTAHLVYVSDGSLRHAVLPPQASSWSNQEPLGSADQFGSPLLAVSPQGALAIAWASGRAPDRRILGTVVTS